MQSEDRKCYLRIEAVNFDESIYDTNDLSTIRGGSFLVLDACRKAADPMRKEWFASSGDGGAEVLFLGASRVVVRGCLAEGVEPRGLVKVVRAWLGEKYPGLWFTVVVVPVNDLPAPFGQQLAVLDSLARFQQIGYPCETLGQWNTDPSIAPCPVHLRRAGTKGEFLPDKEPGSTKRVKLSASVAFRRDTGRQARKDLLERELGGQIPVEPTDSFDQLCCNRPDGVGQLLEGKMAVFYADGNSFGKRTFNQLNSPEAEQNYRSFNDQIAAKHRALLHHLVDTVFGRRKNDGSWTADSLWVTKDGRLRFEILLWGGDEMLFVMPSWCAWEFVRTFVNFMHDWRIGDGELMTYGIGLVFVNHKAPIKSIRELAHELAETAKRSLKERGGDCHVIEYEVLESYDTLGAGLVETRKLRLNRDGKDKDGKEKVLPCLTLRQEAKDGVSSMIGSMLEAIRSLRISVSTRDERRALNAFLDSERAKPPSDWNEQSLKSLAKIGEACYDHETALYHLHSIWNYLP